MQRTHGNQLSLAEEVMIDRIARDLGIDPVEIRLRHAVKAGETLPSQSKVTSFVLGETIEKAVAASGWKEKRGRLGDGRGIGLACGTAFAGLYLGIRFNSSAYMKFNEDGSATLFTGNVDNGQGNESMMVQVAAEELGLPMEDIALVCADSELTPQDPGNYPMLAAFCSANAVRLAASDAKQQIRKIAARRLGVEPKNLKLKDRRVYVAGNPQKGIPISDIVRFSLLEGNAIMGRGSFTPKAASKLGWANWVGGKVTGQQCATYTDGTTVAEVEVDRETGRVRVLNMWLAYDCGFAINPMAVEGQWEGEAVQMVGETLFEKHEWNQKSGELLTSSFLDYKIPTTLDAPANIKAIIVDSVDPKGPYGAKEAGVSGGTGVEAAIANAIYDAIGVEIKEAPVTPEAILRALEEKDKSRT
jgi:4-hydroxybenzoyl-CoA reductase subunit alpha